LGRVPESVAAFLRGPRIAVAGVSRDPRQAANFIFRKLRESGHDVVPVNPNAAEIEGVTCYPHVGAVSGGVSSVVIATHPSAAPDVVRRCAECGVRSVWFHRAFGQGSVSESAVREARSRGLECLVGGCPVMFCEPVDVFHRCMRGWLRWRGRMPG